MSYAAVVDEAGAAPAPALAGLVREYGGSRIEGAAPGIHRGLPSHHLELNICLGDPIALAVMPDPLQPPGSFAALVAGLQTRPAVIAHGGSVYAISVQLSPAGARSLLGVPRRRTRRKYGEPGGAPRLAGQRPRRAAGSRAGLAGPVRRARPGVDGPDRTDR